MASNNGTEMLIPAVLWAAWHLSEEMLENSPDFFSCPIWKIGHTENILAHMMRVSTHSAPPRYFKLNTNPGNAVLRSTGTFTAVSTLRWISWKDQSRMPFHVSEWCHFSKWYSRGHYKGRGKVAVWDNNLNLKGTLAGSFLPCLNADLCFCIFYFDELLDSN